MDSIIPRDIVAHSPNIRPVSVVLPWDSTAHPIWSHKMAVLTNNNIGFKAIILGSLHNDTRKHFEGTHSGHWGKVRQGNDLLERSGKKEVKMVCWFKKESPCYVTAIRLHSHILTTFITLTHTPITKVSLKQAQCFLLSRMVSSTYLKTANINTKNKYY